MFTGALEVILNRALEGILRGPFKWNALGPFKWNTLISIQLHETVYYCRHPTLIVQGANIQHTDLRVKYGDKSAQNTIFTSKARCIMFYPVALPPQYKEGERGSNTVAHSKTKCENNSVSLTPNLEKCPT